jgi:hypothetical protein
MRGQSLCRGIIIVETMKKMQNGYEQKTEYYTVFPDKAPKVITADTVVKQMAQVLPKKIVNRF